MLAALAALLLAFGPGRALAADSGVVEVYGYQWSKVYKVNLDDLQGSPATVNGEQVTVYSLLEILEDASAQQSPANKDFNLQTLQEIEIALPGGGKVTYSGNQIRSGASNVASFYVNGQGVTVMRVPGRGPGGSVAEFEYDGPLNPQLYSPKQILKDFTVSISPPSSTVKTGTRVTFTAKPKGLASGASASYRWTVNGAVQSGSGKTFSRTFSGDSGDTFYVTVTASANGYTDATGAAQVSIDKPAEKPKKEKKPKENQASGGNDSGTYDPGYIPGYTDPYGGGGTGTSGGSPSTGSPTPANPDRKQQDQQPQTEPGQTVTGQLIDPSQISTVVPPSDTPVTGAEEATPADDSGGGLGSVPTGVKAAFGIGALLGIGGLAEAGAFTGRFRRFRP